MGKFFLVDGQCFILSFFLGRPAGGMINVVFFLCVWGGALKPLGGDDGDGGEGML